MLWIFLWPAGDVLMRTDVLEGGCRSARVGGVRRDSCVLRE